MNDVPLRPDHFTDILQSKPNIPAEIPRYVSHCLELGHTNQLIEELRRDPPRTAEGLDRFFGKAADVTGLTQGALLKVTGFSWRDTDPSRIESAIAQLRAIFFLDSQDFSQITPFPREKGGPPTLSRSAPQRSTPSRFSTQSTVRLPVFQANS